MKIKKVYFITLLFCGALILFFNAKSSVLPQQGYSILPLDDLKYFSKVFSIVKNNYIENIDDEIMIKNAITGMISNLDPHSSYLDVDDYKDIKSVTHGEFGGLGIEVTYDNGFIKVISTIEGSPAYKSGIISGDQIIKIDDILTQGLTLHEAVKMMRGIPGSDVLLTVLRESQNNALVFKITRDIVKIDSVRSKIINNNIIYLRIIHFQESTISDMAEYFKTIDGTGCFKGLVLDLRDNPGGLLSSAIEVAGVFLDANSLIVSTRGRAPDSSNDYFSYSDAYYSFLSDKMRCLLRNIPMVVLVNSGSASASEIVAGAMQDYRRAKILGDRTFGKGSVQAILPLSDDSAVKLTISRYFTPSGKSIQARGIDPDYIISDTPLNKKNLFIRRETDLKGHLYNNKKGEIKKEKSDSLNKSFILKKSFEFGDDNDFQLNQAINILYGLPIDISDHLSFNKYKDNEINKY